MFGVLYWSFFALGLFIALMGFPGFYNLVTGHRGGSLDHKGW
ncbi:MAG TPA: hypothetical protein PLR76_03910 [Hyphomonas sp.]|nr:hypothetical protein [Hyphomonas sp.]